MMKLIDERERTGSQAEELLHLNSIEVQLLAHDLDWGNPYTDPEDIKDSLRTNWEQQMDEESVEAVYKVMCEIWDDKNN